MALAHQAAQADTVVFKGGDRKKGIVTKATDEAIFFRQISSQMKIPLTRIEKIEYEDDATDWLELSDLYFSAKKYEQSLESLEKSKTFNPDNPVLALREKAIEQAKVEIALTQGKHSYDKRQSIKERDSKRELDRIKKFRR